MGICKDCDTDIEVGTEVVDEDGYVWHRDCARETGAKIAEREVSWPEVTARWGL